MRFRRNIHARAALRAVVPPMALVAAASVGACQEPTTPAQDDWLTLTRNRFSLEYHSSDAAAARAIVEHIESGMAHVETRFARSYSRPFVARVYPRREAMTERWRAAWSQPAFQAACWMVAAGWASELNVLSPRVWSSEACGHDASSATHLRLLVAHELVHVMHGQANAAYGPLQGGAPWLPEGLAVFASGQWDTEYSSAAHQAARQLAPSTMQELWRSPGGYGLAGSVVAFIAQLPSARGITPLLEAGSWQDVLRGLDLDEATLLARWHAWMLR